MLHTLILIDVIVGIIYQVISVALVLHTKKLYLEEFPVAQFKKPDPFEKTMAALKALIISFCPILNIGGLIYTIFNWENIVWDIMEGFEKMDMAAKRY